MEMIARKRARYSEAMELDGFKRWFFDMMTPRDTPLTLLLEWLTSEGIDLINCSSSRCAHKPYMPIPSGHASEWVCAVASLLLDDGGTDDVDRVLTFHSRRLPCKGDVEKARNGVMTTERPSYGGRFVLRMRTVADFAPKTVAEAMRDCERDVIIDVPAELSVVQRLSKAPESALASIGATTQDWIRTLAAHYEIAAQKCMCAFALARDGDEGDEEERRCAARARAVELTCHALGDPRKVKECVSKFSERVSRCLLSSALGGCAGAATSSVWSALSIGLPFAEWSMLSDLSAADKAFRDEVVGKTRATSRLLASRAPSPAPAAPVDDEDAAATAPSGSEEEPAEQVGAIAIAAAAVAKRPRGRPASRKAALADGPAKVPRFEDVTDSIPGVKRLIETKWAADAENVATVVGPRFREFVLEVKREVKNGPKVSRGRGMLPTHEYIQTITRALHGKTHMYGSGGDGEWFDDYHPAKNPDGCPPWVLAAVVVAACMCGLRHLFDNMRAFRQSVTRTHDHPAAAGRLPRGSKRAKQPHVFTVAGERINFPPMFVSTMAKIAASEVPVTSAAGRADGDDAKRAQSAAATVFWKNLSEDQKDFLAMEHLLRNLRGMATLINDAGRTDSALPAWLEAYIFNVGTPMTPQNPDVDAVRNVVYNESLTSPATWIAKCCPNGEAADKFRVPSPPTEPLAVAELSPPSPPPPPLPPPTKKSRAAAPPVSPLDFKTFAEIALSEVSDRSSFADYAKLAIFAAPGVTLDVVDKLAKTDCLLASLDPQTKQLVEGLAALPRAAAGELLARVTTEEGRRKCGDPNLTSELRGTCPPSQLLAMGRIGCAVRQLVLPSTQNP